MHLDCLRGREEDGEDDNNDNDDVERLALAILEAEDRIMAWQLIQLPKLFKDLSI